MKSIAKRFRGGEQWAVPPFLRQVRLGSGNKLVAITPPGVSWVGWGAKSLNPRSRVCTMRKNLKDGGGDGFVLDDDVADEERQDPAGSGAWWGRLSGLQEGA